MADDEATTSQAMRKAIATEVKIQMTRADKTPADVAEVLGIKRQSVYHRLNGKVDFSATELAKLADFLGVGADEFMPHGAR